MNMYNYIKIDTVITILTILILLFKKWKISLSIDKLNFRIGDK
jgi:hypothetical protein